MCFNRYQFIKKTKAFAVHKNMIYEKKGRKGRKEKRLALVSPIVLVLYNIFIAIIDYWISNLQLFILMTTVAAIQLALVSPASLLVSQRKWIS